jgi:transposase
MTTLLPPGVKVHLALGYVDMRKGIDGLAMLVQGLLRQDPFTGHLFVFRGRTRANLIKIVFWDGTNLGATVVADRWRGLARAGTTLATGDSGITAAAV